MIDPQKRPPGMDGRGAGDETGQERTNVVNIAPVTKLSNDAGLERAKAIRAAMAQRDLEVVEPEVELGPDGKVDINLSDLAALDATADAVVEVIRHRTYVAAGVKLARIVRPSDGTATINYLSRWSIADLASRCARFIEIRVDRKGNQKVIERHPPVDVLEAVLARGEYPGVRVLRGVISHPTMSPTGQVIDTRGYNPETKLFLDLSDNLHGLRVPFEPTSEQVRESVEVLNEWLIDFPFEGDADRAAAFAALLTVLIRPAIDGPVPGWLLSAPAPGTGKTLLATIIALAVLGELPPMTGEASDPNELKKAVEAILIGSPEIFCVDNVLGSVSWGFLAGILTSQKYQARRLGFSEMLSLEILALMVFTANNPTISNEMARRIIVSRLVPNEERPWQRDGFTHADIRTYTLENRARILAAALTLSRAWFAAGQPKPKGKPLGSFESWHRVIGGILAHAGIPGLLDNMNDLLSSGDTEGAAWASFVEAWRAQHGSDLVRVADLVDLALNAGVIDEGRTPRGTQSSLGRALAKYADRIFSGLRVTRGAVLQGIQFWKIVDTGGLGGLGGHVPTAHVGDSQLNPNIYGREEVPQVPQVHPTKGGKHDLEIF